MEVSVIIPIYNAEKYIADTLSTIQNQSFKDIEMLCVNDGSTDRTEEIIRNVATEDSRIVLVNQENEGAGSARNKGLENARGKYLMFLDADDIFQNDLVEEMYNRISSLDAEIVICKCDGYNVSEDMHFDSIDGCLNLDRVPHKEVFSAEDNPDVLFQMSAGWVWDKMYKREFVLEKNIRFPGKGRRVCNDDLFANISFAEAQKICVVDKVLITHRMNLKGSLENTRDRYWMCQIDTLHDEQNELENRGLYEKFKRSFLYRVTEYIFSYMNTIKDYHVFEEYYRFIQEKGIDLFRLRDNKIEYYEKDMYLYEAFLRMMSMSPEEFTRARMNDLNLDFTRSCYYFQKHDRLFDEHDRKVEEYEKKLVYLYAEVNRMKDKKKWFFQEEQLPKGSKVIIYGYGDVGRDFSDWINKSDHLDLVAVADRNFENYENQSVKVISPGAISEYEFDYIIIAIVSSKVCEEVANNLQDMGIDRRKIVFSNLE